MMMIAAMRLVITIVSTMAGLTIMCASKKDAAERGMRGLLLL
jgi:hypothetical protein